MWFTGIIRQCFQDRKPFPEISFRRTAILIGTLQEKLCAMVHLMGPELSENGGGELHIRQEKDIRRSIFRVDHADRIRGPVGKQQDRFLFIKSSAAPPEAKQKQANRAQNPDPFSVYGKKQEQKQQEPDHRKQARGRDLRTRRSKRLRKQADEFQIQRKKPGKKIGKQRNKGKQTRQKKEEKALLLIFIP